MSNGLEKLEINTWFKALLAGSFAVLVAAVAASAHPGIMLVATGGVLIGLGEWLNHPKLVTLTAAYKITNTSRDACIVGYLLDAIGIVVAIVGAYKLIWN